MPEQRDCNETKEPGIIPMTSAEILEAMGEKPKPDCNQDYLKVKELFETIAKYSIERASLLQEIETILKNSRISQSDYIACEMEFDNDHKPTIKLWHRDPENGITQYAKIPLNVFRKFLKRAFEYYCKDQIGGIMANWEGEGVRCAECGRGLCSISRIVKDEISVPNCPVCYDLAKDEGYAKGYKEGYEKGVSDECERIRALI